MSLNEFLSATRAAGQKYAGQYGLTPNELTFALVVNAGLEGGLGERPGVGDGGLSHGRYQFHTGGGHGSTLLNQGWTIDDFYDEYKVVDHWAPILAGALAQAKSEGLSGGEAIATAAFRVERPAYMYPTERVNGVLEQAGGLLGGSVPDVKASSISGRQSTGDVAMGASGGGSDELKRLQDDYFAAQREWLDAGSPVSGPVANRYFGAQDALSFYYDYLAPETESGGRDPAQTAFENALALGEFNRGLANDAYVRWLDKRQTARAEAADEYSAQHEAARARQEQADQNASYGSFSGLYGSHLGPQVVPGRYEDILSRYNERLGVTDTFEPPPPSSIRAPGSAPLAPGFAGSAGTEGDQQQATNALPEGGLMNELYPIPPGRKPTNKISAVLRELPSSSASDNFNYGSTKSTPTPTPQSQEEEDTPWWKKLKPEWHRTSIGLPMLGFAEGGMDIPGGEALVGELGEELVYDPRTGKLVPVGTTGPERVRLPEGADVIPAGVPPDEAYLFAQIRQAAAQPAGKGEDQRMMEAAQRRDDPQLQERVLEELKNAVAAQLALNPPATPQLEDPTRQFDYWAPYRQLTGVPPAQEVMA